MSQFTLDFDGRSLRDAGIGQVLGNAGDEWRMAAQSAITTLPRGWVGLFEEVRAHILACGVPEPHHPHAWGGVASAAIKRGVLRHTGQLRQSEAKANHAHWYRLLERA